jgi:hypothetical protein
MDSHFFMMGNLPEEEILPSIKNTFFSDYLLHQIFAK